MPDSHTAKCPYCAEEIKAEAIKCKYCGEWLENDEQARSKNPVPVEVAAPVQEKPQKLSGLKTVFGIVTFVAFAFIGLVVGSWLGLIVGIFLWLVAAGSIGLSRDISDAGDAARKREK